MSHPVELSGVSIVVAGSFNPAIFHPAWFEGKGLMPPAAIEDALGQDFVAVRELASFTADWLSIQVTLEQASISTVDEARESDLRDIGIGVLDLLPETPVNAVGLNADAHFRVDSEEEWHRVGDTFLPKDFWQPLFEGEPWAARSDGQGTVGMRSMTVEAVREDVTGFVRTEVAPSVRLSPHGVFAGINAHFQLTLDEAHRGNGEEAARIIERHWDATRELHRRLIDRILEL